MNGNEVDTGITDCDRSWRLGGGLAEVVHSCGGRAAVERKHAATAIKALARATFISKSQQAET